MHFDAHVTVEGRGKNKRSLLDKEETRKKRKRESNEDTPLRIQKIIDQV